MNKATYGRLKKKNGTYLGSESDSDGRLTAIDDVLNLVKKSIRPKMLKRKEI